MENQEAYQRAKKRAEAKLGFYLHLAVYIVVNILLIIINLSTSAQYYGRYCPAIRTIFRQFASILAGPANGVFRRTSMKL